MLRDDAVASRFEQDVLEGVVFAAYREQDGVRVITHVETPFAARGKGYAGALMNEIVAYARANAIKLRPQCSYAVTYFARTPNTGDVLA